MFSNIAFFIFVQVTLLLPGYVIGKKSRLALENPLLELGLGYLISLVLFSGLSLLVYAGNLSNYVTTVTGWLIITGSIGIFIKQGYIRSLLPVMIPLVAVCCLSSISTLIAGLSFHSPYTFIPDPKPTAERNYTVQTVKVINLAHTAADDNYIPYRQAQFMVNKSNPATDSFIGEWGVGFFQRTPLMGAVTAFYINLLGESVPIDYTWSTHAADKEDTYQQFTILANVLNALFLVPTAYLASKLFNTRTALSILAFLATSQFFIFNSFFSWPKSLVAFFILLSWSFFLSKKSRFVILGTIASGAAYLTHDLAVLYIGTSAVWLIVSRRFRDAVTMIGGSLLFAIPWLYTAAIIYKKPSSFIYYPFSLHDIPQPLQKKEIIHEFFTTPLQKIVEIKLDSLFFLITPYNLLVNSNHESWVKRIYVSGIFSVPGAVGYGLLVPALIGISSKMRSSAYLLIHILVPIIFCILIIGWPRGLGALHFAESVVVLLSAVGIYKLLKWNKSLLYVAYSVNVIQLLLFICYTYNFKVSAWFTSLRDIWHLALISAFIIGLGAYLNRVLTNRLPEWLIEAF